MKKITIDPTVIEQSERLKKIVSLRKKIIKNAKKTQDALYKTIRAKYVKEREFAVYKAKRKARFATLIKLKSSEIIRQARGFEYVKKDSLTEDNQKILNHITDEIEAVNNIIKDYIERTERFAKRAQEIFECRGT